METGLKDRVVIVTGASQGIGRATALAIAGEGARVAICSRSSANLEAAVNEIRTRQAADVYAEPVDVTDEAAVHAFVDAVAKRWGRIDVCVANAGGPPAKNFLSITTDEWRNGTEQNFLSAAYLAKAVIPHMQRRRWGRFITITSVSVKQPLPDLVISNAVRSAVVGLVKSLANEFGGDGITVNNVAPGYTKTERLQELAGARSLALGIGMEEMYERWAADIPVRRLGQPEEIADAVVFLASERAAYITGHTLLVDGGRYQGV